MRRSTARLLFGGLASSIEKSTFEICLYFEVIYIVCVLQLEIKVLYRDGPLYPITKQLAM